jgi:sugar phosphate isomerase/epimerase
VNRDGVPRIAFSTLACPEWSAETVVRKAASIGFDGVEWRGGSEGTVQTGWSTDQRRSLRRATERAGVVSIAVTAYTSFISGRRDVIRRSVDDVVAHAELAADLGAPVVRIFLGERDDDDGTDADRTRRAVASLSTLLERVRPTGIAVAIEPHDEHVRAASVRPIVEAVDDAALSVVWDIANAWSAGERPADGLAAYDGRIAYVQVKDGTGFGPSWRLCALGLGAVPLDAALTDLVGRCAASSRPLPPISVEWERAWHDHLEPAGVALPAALAWLREHVSRAVERSALTTDGG